MDKVRRVERLRALVAQIELLPASPARDRMLSEFRSRAVDIDTGVAPRAILPLQDFAPLRVPDKPPRRERAPRIERIAPPAAAPPIKLPSSDTLHEPLAFDERLSLHDSLPSSAVQPWTRGLRG